MVKEGDVITYELPEKRSLEYKVEDIPMDIIYEDVDVAVVKVWWSIPSWSHRLVPWSRPMYHVKDLSVHQWCGSGPGIVHCNDKRHVRSL